MADVAADLRRALPGLRASSDEADRVAYSRDLWPRHHMEVRAGRPAEHRPGSIVWPETTEEVAGVVRWAKEHGVPLVPFGAGSGVCGGVSPREDVVVVDLKRLARIRAIDADAPFVDVEAGHMGVPFEEALGRAGLTLGHFPSSILCSTVGGWIAARGAGQCSGLYGKIEDMVVSVECVTGAGDVVELRRRRSGPDLLDAARRRERGDLRAGDELPPAPAPRPGRPRVRRLVLPHDARRLGGDARHVPGGSAAGRLAPLRSVRRDAREAGRSPGAARRELAGGSAPPARTTGASTPGRGRGRLRGRSGGPRSVPCSAGPGPSTSCCTRGPRRARSGAPCSWSSSRARRRTPPTVSRRRAPSANPWAASGRERRRPAGGSRIGTPSATGRRRSSRTVPSSTRWRSRRAGPASAPSTTLYATRSARASS